MSFWYTEDDNVGLRLSFRVNDVLFTGQSDFQRVEVIDTVTYGRMLVLDGYVMITDQDEFVYHEMISHIPACLHKDPRNVLVIGGGDGGTVRELLKHDCIEKVTLCEIDQMVIDASKKYFPKVADAMDDPRCDVKVGDGIAFMKDQREAFDIILIDSTDPIGPGEGLFTSDFYKSVAQALKPGGLMAAQSESPWHGKELLNGIRANIKAGFPHIRSYIAPIPTYPRGFWSWTMAQMDAIDPTSFDRQRFAKVADSLEFLSEDGFTAAFALPPFYRRKLEF